jgi:hypothetical protein
MRSRLAAGCLAAVLLVATLPMPAAAVSAIPDETGVELPGGARSAMVGDVDADGLRELVTIRRWQSDPGRLAVEVSQIDKSGRLVPAGQVLLRRVASPEDLLTGGARPDEEGMLVVGAAEPARLLAWRVDGMERVIVAGVGTEALPRPSGPTLWEVGLDPSGATQLRFLYDSQAAGSSIYAIDLDGDGTDELVIGEPPELLLPDEVQLRVLRWDGATFSKTTFFLSPALGSDFAPLGNSDGRPGEELGMIAVPNEADMPALLHRISLDDAGMPRRELKGIPFVGELAAMPGSDGGRILLASPGNGLRLLDWPAGGEISDEATSPQRGFPLAVLGTGADARLLLRDEGLLHVLDESLIERRVIERSAAAAQFRNSFLAPFGGQVPGGLPDNRPAVFFRGRLVTLGTGGARPDGDPLSERVVAVLPGISPIGVFGPEGAWMALATATRFDAQRSGGRLTAGAPIDPVRVTVARTDDVFRPEVDGGALEPTVSGAITEQRSAERPLLLARGSFAVEFPGPPGSSVALENGDPDDLLQLEIGARGVVRVTVEPPSPAGTDDEVFSARLQVVTPAGHGYVIRWEVQIRREPPAVAATTPVAPLSFSVPVRGRTDPGATVLVDGVPVEVRADGSFEAQVPAGPIPRDVRIQVTDRVGNSVQHTLSVVGLVDFRRLPWIPVVAVLTVLAGAVLYLRAPRPSRPAVRGAGDDATFEEID